MCHSFGSLHIVAYAEFFSHRGRRDYAFAFACQLDDQPWRKQQLGPEGPESSSLPVVDSEKLTQLMNIAKASAHFSALRLFDLLAASALFLLFNIFLAVLCGMQDLSLLQ